MNKWVKNWRYNIILLFIGIFACLILYQLFSLQVKSFEFYQAQALGQQTRIEELIGERGDIFFSKGERVLASNKNQWRLFAVPYEIEKKERTAQKLKEGLNDINGNIVDKLNREKYYVVIENELTDQELEFFKENDLEGVYLERYSGRYYPQGKMASQVIGFVGGEGKGQYGIEGYYDNLLRGEIDRIEKKRTILGYLFDEEYSGTLKGDDVYLTLDYGIQFQAESLLKESMNKYGAEGGQIIVMEPGTGEVLALADLPNFNPNHYREVRDLALFQNKAVQHKLEPGSVFKVITSAIALNEGKITPETTYVDKGHLEIGGWTIRNYDRRVWGETTMTEVLESSINTGAVFMQKLISNEVFIDYFDKFGFDEKTGIEIQGEVSSGNINLRRGRDIGFATASYGQGVSVTPIQLVRAFSTIANRGVMKEPSIIEKIITEEGEEKTKDSEESVVIGSKAASQATSMMISTIENGFSKKAKIPGYYLAGKTGTAQIPYKDRQGYNPNKTNQLFVGFGPALDPQFVILVNLKNPQTRTAEYSALPVFRELAEYIINYKQIPPDYET